MNPLAKRRCLAYLTDCAGYLGVAAAMIPPGVLVATTRELGREPLYGHLVSMVPPAIATVLAARAESGTHRATWGKRRQGLEVIGADGGALSLGDALGRNLAKIFLPWQLAHTLGVGAAHGGFERRDPLTLSATVATYGVIGLYAWSGLRGSGRALPDLLVGSRVVLTAPARS